MSLKELGELVDLTAAAVSYRINKLTKNDIIEDFTININYQQLTPSYQSYIIRASTNNLPKDINPQDIFSELNKSNMTQKIIKVADSESLFGITLPLSSNDLKRLSNLLSELNLTNYTIIPILDEFTKNNKDIIGENIGELYCPVCQNQVDADEGIISTVGKQILTFCCRDCKDKFQKNLDSISSKA